MTVKRWVPLAAVTLVVAIAAGVAVAARQGGGASGTGLGAAPTSDAPAADRAVVTTVVAPAVAASVAKVALDHVLASGSVGDDVTRLQQRLVDLAFDPGPVDGQFGPATQSAVWAYQKLVVGLSGKD